jgi:predicted RNA-binding Zn ribbon-like protein
VVTILADFAVTGQDGDVKHVFVSGEAALDFVGTLKWRRDEPEELLGEPADLAAWAQESGILSDAIVVTTEGLTTAKSLRENIYQLVVARTVGAPRRSEAVVVVNDFAAGTPVRPVLTESGLRREGDEQALLSSLARNALKVAADESIVLKECGREQCTRIFIDRSRGSRREWCGMDECGNRIKSASYRRRIASRRSE